MVSLAETPLTGKPDAGNPPVRFGGRGGANAPSLPLSKSRAGLDAQNRPVRVLRAPAKNETPKDERRPGERERQQPKRMRTIAPQGQTRKANERSNQCGGAGGFDDGGLEQGAHTASLS